MKICRTVDLLFEVFVFLILNPTLNNVSMAVARTADLMSPAPHYFSGTLKCWFGVRRNVLTVVTIKVRSVPLYDAV